MEPVFIFRMILTNPGIEEVLDIWAPRCGTQIIVKKFTALIINNDDRFSVLNWFPAFKSFNYAVSHNYKMTMNAHYCGYFMNVLVNSPKYAQLVANNLFEYSHKLHPHLLIFKCVVRMIIILKWPESLIIDYKSNQLYQSLSQKYCALNYVMAWLSTLGGAFSALGDDLSYFAKMAGTISVQQLKLALQLSDPNIVIRCKLYISLCFIQHKKFSKARKIIQNQHKLIKSGPVVDQRLLAMCFGIWAKLKYELLKSKLQNSI